MMRRVSRRAILAGFAAAASWLASARGASIELDGTGKKLGPNQVDGEGVGVKGAARWLEQSQFIVSSLETGRVGYLEAWGGDEFGFAYTFALSGQPAGVTIDADYGMLSIGTALAAGIYNFNVIVTNRKITTKVATFPISINVLPGVTSGWVAGKILHKTYSADNAALYGAPTGSDYTQVLLNIQAAIIADQNTVGDGNLRATITFSRGIAYTYTFNRFAIGLQYVTMRDDPATTGSLPTLQCVLNVDGGFSYYYGPLSCGNAGFLTHLDPPGMKALSAKLNPVSIGDSVVTLKSSADAANLGVGRWHMIVGNTQQTGGYPPNCTYIDFVKVASISGPTVTLDRRVRYRYSDTWFENPTDDSSFGMVRIGCLDTGGLSNSNFTSDPRGTLRLTALNIVFIVNPTTVPNSVDGTGVVYLEGVIDASFENCTVPHIVPTMSKEVRYLNCTIGGGEPDKLSEMLIFDGCTTATLDAATGFLYWLSRNTSHGCVQISPHQFRALNTIFDPAGDTFFNWPVTTTFNGPIWYFDIKGCTFKPNVTNLTLNWTPDGHPNSQSNVPVVIGTDATWFGNQLRIPRSFANFEVWLTTAYAGLILSVAGTAPVSANWGYVSNVTSPGDGTALWLDVVWVNGSKPLSGNIYPIGRFQRLDFANNTFVAPMAWGDPQFVSERAAPNANWDFPAGYPASDYGF
jgi:hypothetical protein